MVAPRRKKARRDTSSSQEGLARVKSEAEAEPSVNFLPFRPLSWASGLGKDLQVGPASHSSPSDLSPVNRQGPSGRTILSCHPFRPQSWASGLGKDLQVGPASPSSLQTSVLGLGKDRQVGTSSPASPSDLSPCSSGLGKDL